MKTIKLTYDLFKYDELCDGSKKRALDKFNEHNLYNNTLYDVMNEWLLYQLEEKKIDIKDNLKLLYSLSYSQGDGVCFTGIFEWQNLRITITNNSRYVHERSVNFDFYPIDGLALSSSETNEFKNLYESICKDIERCGYDEIEYQESEENFQNLCEINDYWFYINGKLFDTYPGVVINE